MARNNRVEEPLGQRQIPVESKLPGRIYEEPQKRQEDTAGKTETFFTRNVKLITFLICITVIFSPFVITYIQDTVEARQEAERPEMTVDELTRIASIGKDLRQRDLAKFEDYQEEVDMQGMKYASYRIPILHERDCYLSISFDMNMDYVFYINLIDLDTREELDLLSEADKLEAFLTSPAN